VILKLIPDRNLLRLVLPFFLLNTFSVFAGGIDIHEPGISGWYNLIGADITVVEDVLGDSYTDIDPPAAGSRAERILWYKNGITLWMDDGRVMQLRLDSAVEGAVSGISIGSPVSEVLEIFGRPWIEDAVNLYYNLPWRSGPVRLRLIFADSGLSEIYLYIVR
jgi:hypothetical protein